MIAGADSSQRDRPYRILFSNPNLKDSRPAEAGPGLAARGALGTKDAPGLKPHNSVAKVFFSHTVLTHASQSGSSVWLMTSDLFREGFVKRERGAAVVVGG